MPLGGALINLLSRRVDPRKSKFPVEMLDLIDEVIDTFYLVKNGLNVSQCYSKLKEAYDSKEVYEKLVSRSQFYEICNSIDQYEYVLARLGREHARKLLQNSEEVIWADYPLQYVEIDAVHLNLGILSDSGDFLGTIIIYVCIDRFSRCVLGFSTSIKREKRGENADSVIECIKHSVFPKPPVDYCNNDWCSFGLPAYFIFDAGSAFNNLNVSSYILHIESNRIITQTKTPKKKPFIERFYRTLREQFAKRIPGYVGKRMDGEALDEPIQEIATVTQSEVERLLTIYICDYYHQSTHRGLDNYTPEQVWREYYAQAHTSPRLPANPDAVEVFAGTNESGKLCGKSGVRLNKLSYNNRTLRDLYFALAGNKNKKIEISYVYNKNDISKIHVIDPRTGELFMVPCSNKRILPGTSLNEYRSHLSGNASNKKYMAFTDPAVSDVLVKKPLKKNKKVNRSANRPDKAVITPPITSADIANMLAIGAGRMAQKIELDCHEISDDGVFFDVSKIDDFDLEEK